MTDFDFLLQDRIQKIQSINTLYDLEHKAYLSFSGGKDSCVLSRLIDLALPDNQIPRVFINTGIEYSLIYNFVKEFGKSDSRLQIIAPAQNIRDMLETDGYPFKSKDHSHHLAIYQRSGYTKTIVNYLGKGQKESFLCPDVLKYQFSDSFKIKVSDKCCYRLKKYPAEKWSNLNRKPIAITGMRKAEGGARKALKSCTVFYSDNVDDLRKFHPLLVVSDEWVDEFVKRQGIKLCELYYPPYNFERTGCCGCPFNTKLQKELDVMQALLLSDRKKAESIWKPIYSEYRRIGYRVTKDTLFDEP